MDQDQFSELRHYLQRIDGHLEVLAKSQQAQDMLLERLMSAQAQETHATDSYFEQKMVKTAFEEAIE